MEAQQAVEILGIVKAIWTRQPVDKLIAGQWVECLVRVSFEAGRQAVREFRDAGRADAPTPGEVWKLAQDIDDRSARARAAGRLRLVEPKPSDEQVQRNRATLHEIIDQIGRKA